MKDTDTSRIYSIYNYLNENKKVARIKSVKTINSRGDELWIYSGSRFHREDGPAVILADGTEMWWQYDNLHRADGPAIMRPGGNMEWWYNGTLFNSPEAWAEEVLADAGKPSSCDHVRDFLRSILKSNIQQSL